MKLSPHDWTNYKSLDFIYLEELPKQSPRHSLAPDPVHPDQEPRNQTGSGLFHSIVKEQVLPGQLEGQQTIANSTRPPGNVKRNIHAQNGFSLMRSESIVPPGLASFRPALPALRYASCRASYGRRSAADTMPEHTAHRRVLGISRPRAIAFVAPCTASAGGAIVISPAQARPPSAGAAHCRAT